MENILMNVRKIRENKDYSQEYLASKMNITQAKYARFERGSSKTDLKLLQVFADVVKMNLIDVITYPKKYVDSETLVSFDSDIKAVLQIELKKDKKEKVLELVFGEKNLEILNK